jgi:hypothetical protein
VSSGRAEGGGSVATMAIARFKDLCIDANEPAALGRFWAAVLGRQWEPGAEAGASGRIIGPTPQHCVWVTRVPEAKAAKHRVHLDIYVSDLATLVALGSEPAGGDGPGLTWTVMKDPEAGEYCAFLRPEPPAERLHGLVVDSLDPAAQAAWWSAIYDAELVHDARGFSTVTAVPGMPILTMDFVPVPEPKTVKNRVHWDVAVADLRPLVDAGAVVLRPEGDDIAWNVMADPEGNEFCAFVDERPS